MVIKAVVFDVDDTLYDQQEPFKKAVTAICPVFMAEDFPELYKQFRYYSDTIYPKVMTGEWTLEDMRCHRISQSLKDLDYPALTTKEALRFQELYELELDQITLHDEVAKTLDYLKKQNIPMGVITNGPFDHQSKKIKQLAVKNWIQPEKIIISETTGYQKPEREIFEIAAENFDFNPENTLYIGDNFISDVTGSKKSGWKSLWFNHRQRQVPKGQSAIFDYEIQSFPQLFETIQNIF